MVPKTLFGQTLSAVFHRDHVNGQRSALLSCASGRCVDIVPRAAFVLAVRDTASPFAAMAIEVAGAITLTVEVEYELAR
jgi:hypothetical protein